MFRNSLEKVINNKDLMEEEMIDVMENIMENKVSDISKASFLTALKIKGETVTEIRGAAKVMRNKVSQVDLSEYNTLDTCGTGGDGLNTYNISTAAGIICAANDVMVVKHGNRSVSSKSGSADVLEALGMNINLKSDLVRASVKEENFGFFFAPNFHSAMKNVMNTRKSLGFRTIFNILGPLTNPAFAKTQILGVFDANLTETLAEVLMGLGVKRALVVHGMDGLDEITIEGETKITEVIDEKIRTYYIYPEMYGLKSAKNSLLMGGEAKDNAMIIQEIFNGKKGPMRDVLLLNAGAALYVSDRVNSIASGIALAEKTIDSKKALYKLNRIIERSKVKI
jgi:anthranilate phosphoribosyltransferase